MKKIIVPIVAAVMTISVAVPSITLAQNAQNGMGKNMPAFADFDMNDDGTITEDEFNIARSERVAKHMSEGRQMKGLANAPTFNDIDLDDDGGVSAEEFSAHQAEHKAQRSKH
jgi:Ca2+-binding EF-hand superfamily protein